MVRVSLTAYEDGLWLWWVETNNPGKGEYSRWLDTLPRHVRIVCSGVMNQRIATPLEHRGFKPMSGPHSPWPRGYVREVGLFSVQDSVK